MGRLERSETNMSEASRQKGWVDGCERGKRKKGCQLYG